jgi:uncharacterized protein (UPF0264 family)
MGKTKVSSVDAFHGGADAIDVEQVTQDDLGAQFTECVGASVVLVDERSHPVAGVVQGFDGGVARRSCSACDQYV